MPKNKKKQHGTPDKSILMVLTSNTEMGDDSRETGFWFEEMSVPYYIFKDAGIHVDIVTIEGGAAHPDASSLVDAAQKAKNVARFLEDAAAMAALQETQPIDQIRSEKYSGVFLPGGHGAMWDFPENPFLSRILSDFYAEGKLIATLCHGASAFVGAEKPNGRPIVEGHRINCFTNEEEKAAGLDEIVPFLLETRVRKLGGKFEAVENFQAHAVKDRQLITGQNPASSEMTAILMRDSLI